MENGLSNNRTANIVFSGRSDEYFKLWFVNMFLSIITLGIYSAWAKVRNTQYMYGHTHVDDNSFRFLASPMQILKGRIVAVVIFILYMVLSKLSPAFGIAMALAFLVAFPWLIIQGMKFTMRMTAYRNVRFSFEGTYGGVVIHFILLPILGAITLYLAMPWVIQKIQQYIHNNMTYGGRHFEQKSSAGQYYIAALFTIGIALIGTSLIAVFGATAIASASAGPSLGLVFVGLSGFALFGIINAIYQSMIFNHLMKTLEIDGVVSFDANMKTLPFAALVLTNILLIICTFGLAIPIVKIRAARYIASVTEVTIKPGINELVNTVESTDSAIGEEAAGLFDTDFSIA